MNEMYLNQCQEKQEKLNQLLRQASDQQYIEYISSKLDDLLEYQKQKNSENGMIKETDQKTQELSELCYELNQRFSSVIKQLDKKYEQSIEQQVTFKEDLRLKEIKEINQLEQQQKDIDKAFKENLRSIHKKQ